MNMDKLLLFDVDGTLVDSGKEIDSYMVSVLKELKKNGYHIGIVGGGNIDKILNQMKSEISFEHYFSECGCVYYKNMINDKLALEKVYEKNIRNHELYHYINILIKKALDFLSKVEYTITGNFIDLRTGIIYISLIGMSANESEREYFKEYDKTYKIREQLLILLNQTAKSFGYNVFPSCKTMKELENSVHKFFSSSECSFMEIIARPGFRNDLGRPTSSPIENKKCFMHSIQE